MGEGSAVGKIIREEGDTSGMEITVAGVTNDYVYGNMYGKPDPVMFIICTAPEHANKKYIRLKSGQQAEQALAKIEAVIKKSNPAYPFNYRFVDDQFNRMFQSEVLIGKLSRIFAALAIMISCLGIIWPGSLYRRAENERNRCKKSIGRQCCRDSRPGFKRFLKAGGCLPAWLHSL